MGMARKLWWLLDAAPGLPWLGFHRVKRRGGGGDGKFPWYAIVTPPVRGTELGWQSEALQAGGVGAPGIVTGVGGLPYEIGGVEVVSLWRL